MRKHPVTWRRGRSGMAMMYAILVVAIAGIVAYGYIAAQSTSLAIGRNLDRHARARAVAESALELAIGYIRANDDWRTVQSSGEWIADAALGDGTFSVRGEDGIPVDGNGEVDGDGDLADDPLDSLTLTVRGKVENATHVVRAVLTPMAVPVTPLLLVVPDPASLQAADESRKRLFRAWGYDVTLIGTGASQQAYDEAIADNALIYISGSVGSTLAISKIREAPIGLVNESAGLYADLSIATAAGYPTGTIIAIVDNTHEITSDFATGDLTILDASQDLRDQRGTLAPGAGVLANRVAGSEATLTIVEKGDTLLDGTPAAGRRVLLPWGSGAFDVGALNADGVTLLQNALAWAAADSGISILNVGNTTAYASEQSSVQRTQIATQVILEEDATLTGITAYVKGPPPKELRYAIYADSGGEPDSLIAQTPSEAVGNNEFHWHAIAVDPVALSAGTYWLALAFEHNGMSYAYATTGQTRTRNNDAVKNGFTAPWGSSNASPSRRLSIYAFATVTDPDGEGEQEPESVRYIYHVNWK